MRVTYIRRFRMEIDLGQIESVPELPDGYYWLGWHESLLDIHAQVKYHCFHDQLDAVVFPSLAERHGCYYLMSEIRGKSGFLPEATWLIASRDEHCGTVQGVRERTGLGAIQNLGVTPSHRGKGLGEALLLKALWGFRRRGLTRVYLEVTANNDAAVRLYRRVGFQCRKTSYKAVEAPLLVMA